MKNTLTYRSLVAYIISVVPEIMEDFHICSECSHSRESHYWNGGGLKEYSEEDSSCHSCGCEEYKHSVTKIIGRPITLEDILIAAFVSKIDLGIKVTDKTTVRLMHVTASMMSTKTDWLLSKPLSGQDKRTIIWLKSIFPIAK